MYQIDNDLIEVLYQDDDLMVVVKPHRMLSVPGRGEHKQDCLLNRLAQNHSSVRIVHRLDYDTSGLMVLALNTESHRRLSRLFEQRQVAKAYLARVDGQLPAAKGGIDLPLALDWHHRPRHRIDFMQGRKAQTGWEILAHQQGNTLIRLYPYTGRSHQLRVHMLALGCPILGDPLYHPNPHTAPRLCLHAAQLSFRHPQQGKWFSFDSPAPF